MRAGWLVVFLASLQEPPSFDAGTRELADVSPGGWNRRLGPDASSAKKPPLLYLPPSKPCPFARNNGGRSQQQDDNHVPHDRSSARIR